MKKKWYRNNWVKCILVIVLLSSVAVGAVFGTLAIAMAEQGFYVWEEDGDTYIESEALTSKVFTDVHRILNGLEAESILSSEDMEEPDKVIDLQEVYEDKDYTFRNTSGLAYSMADLKDWSESFESADWGEKNVVVCVSTDGNEKDYYYYYDEFCNMVKNGDIAFELEELNLEGETEEDAVNEVLESLKYSWIYNTDYALRSIKDKTRNTEYECIYTLEDDFLVEKYSPVGADNLLDVLNENPNWQGRIEDAYAALHEILVRLLGMSEAIDLLQANYQEGDTNLIYFYADPDKRTVYTNKSAFAAKAGRPESYEECLQEISQMDAFTIVKPKLGECLSNMNFGDEQGLMTWQHTVEQEGFIDNYIFAVAVDGKFAIEDSYASINRNYEKYVAIKGPVMILLILAAALFLISLAWLTVIAGRRTTDEGIYLNGFDRIYTEIAAALVLVGGVVPALGVLHLLSYRISSTDKVFLALVTGIGFYTAAVCLVGYLSFIRRAKARTLWKNSVLKRILRIGKKLLKKIGEVLELYSRNTLSKIKLTLLAGMFLLLQFAMCGFAFGDSASWLILLFLIDCLALLYILWRADGTDKILEGLKRISNGELQYKIPTERLKGDQKAMAEYINNIGSGLDAAVDNSLKNERMKTELITNVSHDIKTPLTSIINYVDLLKRENFTDPKICGYLDVLESKAQRLKVLTEDVVEASKASSGTLKLEMMNLDFSEMLYQVMGEFEERFEERNLTLMVHLAESPVTICADGQRLWRVLENVFSNVVKYALEGTRVYVQTTPEKGRIVFSLKNISAQPLNFSADELTERFIRGDVSRNTEGSGLGLSIAKSLTELQGGDFRLYLDGDLFKVIITFPLVKTEENLKKNQK